MVQRLGETHRRGKADCKDWKDKEPWLFADTRHSCWKTLKVETVMKGLVLVGTHVGCLFQMMWITAVLLHRILSCLELRLDWSCEVLQWHWGCKHKHDDNPKCPWVQLLPLLFGNSAGNSIFARVMSCHVNIQCVKFKLRFDRGVLNRWPGAREKSQQSQSQTANWLTNYIRETGFWGKPCLGFLLGMAIYMTNTYILYIYYSYKYTQFRLRIN